MPLEHVATRPTLRSFDEAKAKQFYRDFLGFSVDWEHRFAADLPLFMQVSRAGIVLWLSEHHGDGSPGVHVTIEVTGLRAFHAELLAKNDKHARPGIEPFIAGGIEVVVFDPAGNRLAFVEREPAAAQALAEPRARLEEHARLSAISPLFIVRDVVAASAFYRELLGFALTFSTPEQAPFFAIVRRDGAELLLKAPDESIGALPNVARHPWVRWDAFVNVADPDALAQEFRARGVAMHTPAENVEDGLSGFEVRDPDGYVLFFGCPL